MQCQGITKSGRQCRNQATANGYCHLHGGLPSKKVMRREAEEAYARMTPEERAEVDGMKVGCMLIIILLAFILALITGDIDGFLKWMSR